MYMPTQNYEDMEPEILKAYRMEGKDVRGVRNFSRLVQEVFYFGDDNFQSLQKFLNERLEYNLKDHQENGDNPEEARLEDEEERLRQIAEEEIHRRMLIISEYVTQGKKSHDYSSLDAVFQKMDKSKPTTGIPSRREEGSIEKRSVKKDSLEAKNVS
jgi:hypothetical protein